MRILGVDDDLIARSMLFEALKLSGHDEIVLASSGADALRKIQLSETPFDSFLLDIQMDDMDGISLCEQIRQLPGYAEVPIIMVTGLGDKQHMELAFRAGATDYVNKPFDMMELGARVQVAEMMGQKIKMIAQNEAEISKLRNIVENLGTKRNAPSLEIATAGFIAQDVLESSLQQLSPSDLAYSVLVKCQIVNFEKISVRCLEEDKEALLQDVAVAIGNVFDRGRFLAAYAGDGMFVILFRHTPPSDQELVQVQENLNEIRLSAGAGRSDFVMLDFGEQVYCKQLSVSDLFRTFQDEQESSTSRTRNLDIVIGEVEDTQVCETPQQKFERRLKRMVPHYVSVLSDAMVHLEILHENLRVNQSSWEEINDIESTAHKIAGVAPSLGFAKLGAAAADIEKLAAEAPRTNDFSKSRLPIETALGVLLDRIEDTIVENYVS